MKRAQPKTYGEACAMMLEGVGEYFAALADSTTAPTKQQRRLCRDISKTCLSLAHAALAGRAPAKGKRAARRAA